MLKVTFVRGEMASGVTPTAWRMYKYSLFYLALLLTAMGIDKHLPFGQHAPTPDIMILDKPDGGK
jgi:heme O synthase-like polyprenyltransferase